jgi:transketolase
MIQDVSTLGACARKVRAHILQMAHAAQAPHAGSALSCADLLVALYWRVLRIDPSAPNDPNRDRFILSKGHASTAQYAALAERGFFPNSVLGEYARDGGRLAEHAGPRCVPGIEAATGSLGHGLAIGVGLALAAKLQGARYRVFVILSDGECYEGSVWEAALLASAQRLDNLVALIDFNGWSAMVRTRETLEPLAEKWRSFGWAVQEIDGHDFNAIVPALEPAPFEPERPSMIVARTIKGKGVSFMEDDLEWHYRPPSNGDLARALREIGA